MNCCLPLAALFVCLVLPISTCASDLSRVVQAMEDDLGVHHTHIPMLGMAMFVGKVASGFQMPAVKLAVFEDAGLSEHSPQELGSALASALGAQWSPFVKSVSNHGSEQNWIYVRQDSKRWQMCIATVETNELSLVEVTVSEREMRRWINHTDEMARRH
jgi:hypothetical protein